VRSQNLWPLRLGRPCRK